MATSIPVVGEVWPWADRKSASFGEAVREIHYGRGSRGTCRMDRAFRQRLVRESCFEGIAELPIVFQIA